MDLYSRSAIYSMNSDFLARLRCPETGTSLALNDRGDLQNADGRNIFTVKDGIPRFVAQDNYASNFGRQWNAFRQTQLDSFSGIPISADRFWAATGWEPKDLEGKWVLDIGCGAGRFAEIALGAGANLVALDYSTAIDACAANFKHSDRLHLAQGNIYQLPFAPESFDFVYSLGVLQHTPDVKAAFMALPPMLRPGGKLCVDYYWRRLPTLLHAKYLVRPVTKRMSQENLFSLIENNVDWLRAVSGALSAVPLAGRALKRLVPIADYRGIFPLTETQQREWTIMDTFDMLAPRYDNPQTASTARRWMDDAGMTNVEVFHAAHLVARGWKPLPSQP